MNMDLYLPLSGEWTEIEKSVFPFVDPGPTQGARDFDQTLDLLGYEAPGTDGTEVYTNGGRLIGYVVRSSENLPGGFIAEAIASTPANEPLGKAGVGVDGEIVAAAWSGVHVSADEFLKRFLTHVRTADERAFIPDTEMEEAA